LTSERKGVEYAMNAIRSRNALLASTLCIGLAAFGLVPTRAFGQNNGARDRLGVIGFIERLHATGRGTLDDRLFREDAITRLGAGMTRLSFRWDDVEAQRGTFRWSTLDSIVGELNGRGIKVIGLLLGSPTWARPDGIEARHRPVVDGSAAKGDTAFAAFAAAAARRYQGKVVAWEVWNEPNGVGWWLHTVDGTNRGPDPADYAELWKVTSDSLTVASPGVPVLLGSLAAGLGTTRTVRDPLGTFRLMQQAPPADFLQAVLATGVHPTDVSIHVYSPTPPGVKTRGLRGRVVFPDLVFDSVLAVLRRSPSAGAGIWVTEWGVDARSAGNDQAQVAWFCAALGRMLAEPRVRVVMVYALRSNPDFGKYDLVDSAGQPLPVGRALTALGNTGKCP
jgi:hypothetical protein